MPNAVEQTVSAVLQEVNGASLAGVSGALWNLKRTEQLWTGHSDAGDQFVEDIYADAATRIDQLPDSVRYTTTTGEDEDDVDDGFGQSVPGMGSMFVMFTVLGGMALLLRERQQWTLQRLAALPLSRAQILSGKILTYFTLGMIQFLIIFGWGYLSDSDSAQIHLRCSDYDCVHLCCTAIAFAIAPRLTSTNQASGITQLLSLSFAPLGGACGPWKFT
ncbi:ABC transporter permease [Chloroflexi bacterium TSY]|nr:ABC transporter permease [Chloroflexi bacterium TSY]